MQKTILSTADVATLFNVTETTVKRWADDGILKCQKTPGGHRKYDTKHLVEFADTFGFSPNATLKLDEKQEDRNVLQAAILERDFDAIAAAYAHRALADEGPGLHDFFSYLYQHNIRFWEIVDRVIHPGMKSIGDGWKRGEINVGLEHRSSQRTLEALSQLRPHLHIKAPNGQAALCACPDEVMHEIGLRCASFLLEAEGWKVHYLGANTPIESILEVQAGIRPSLICLSISMVDIDKPITARLRRVYRAASERNARVVIGGPHALEHHIGKSECHKLVHSCYELLEFIGGTKRGQKH